MAACKWCGGEIGAGQVLCAACLAVEGPGGTLRGLQAIAQRRHAIQRREEEAAAQEVEWGGEVETVGRLAAAAQVSAVAFLARLQRVAPECLLGDDEESDDRRELSRAGKRQRADETEEARAQASWAQEADGTWSPPL